MRPLLIVMATVAMSCGSASDLIEFSSETPDDVRQLAQAAMTDFLEVFPAQRQCVAGVRLDIDPDFEARGRYEPETATVILRTPATAPKLRESLFHELAHHLEWNCPSQLELRKPFLDAQGFSAGSEWTKGDAWEDSPSEHFAEAVVEVIEGRRNLTYGINLSDQALELVRRWGHG